MINNMGAILTEVQRLQQELKNKTIEVSEGEGAFRVIINGHQEVLDARFSPSVLSPEKADELRAIVVRAVNRAIDESKQMIKSELGKLTGSLNLPDISGLF
ncbi:MAG: YbaB/EbfC family nucleoid-associated protein [Pelotomaculum sp.]|nr:YbaB/EbfC family nucleoid-associated protein [Pelotomaculum sp.]